MNLLQSFALHMLQKGEDKAQNFSLYFSLQLDVRVYVRVYMPVRVYLSLSLCMNTAGYEEWRVKESFFLLRLFFVFFFFCRAGSGPVAEMHRNDSQKSNRPQNSLDRVESFRYPKTNQERKKERQVCIDALPSAPMCLKTSCLDYPPLSAPSASSSSSSSACPCPVYFLAGVVSSLVGLRVFPYSALLFLSSLLLAVA